MKMRLPSTLRVASPLLCVLLMKTANAHAQATTFYVDRLQIGGAPADGVAVWNPEINGTRAFMHAALGVAYRPLRSETIVRNDADAAAFQGPPLTHQFIVYATVGAEIKDRVLVSATLPMLFSQDGLPTYRPALGYNDAVNIVPSTLFDMRLEGRVRIFETAGKSFRLGMRGALMLPIGDESSYTGDTSVWGQLGLATDLRAKRIAGTLNLGVSLRPDARLNAFSVGHEFNYGFGLYVPIAQRIRVGAELFGSTGLTRETRKSEKNTPLEWSLQIRYTRAKKKLQGWIGLSGGTRLTDSYAPDFRIVGLAGLAIPPDVDKLLNSRPPTGDRDGDGYPDKIDACPTAQEDGQGFLEGCPERKILDPDKDRDGLKTPGDRCPDDPEDKDGIDDDDGCPEEDADADQVLDTADKCPKEPGVSGGEPDKEGCPQFVERVDERIEIRQQIAFGFDTATIETRSHPILKEIALVLKKNPQIRLSIEGHTDEVGTDEYNEQLSKQRTQAVLEHLVGLGIDRDRLTAKWFGRAKPLTQDSSDEGHAKNRRVEFRIE